MCSWQDESDTPMNVDRSGPLVHGGSVHVVNFLSSTTTFFLKDGARRESQGLFGPAEPRARERESGSPSPFGSSPSVEEISFRLISGRGRLFRPGVGQSITQRANQASWLLCRRLLPRTDSRGTRTEEVVGRDAPSVFGVSEGPLSSANGQTHRTNTTHLLTHTCHDKP